MHVKVILEFLPSRKKHLQFLQKILQISHEDVNHLIRLDVMLDAQSVQVSSTQNHTEKCIYTGKEGFLEKVCCFNVSFLPESPQGEVLG